MQARFSGGGELAIRPLTVEQLVASKATLRIVVDEVNVAGRIALAKTPMTMTVRGYGEPLSVCARCMGSESIAPRGSTGHVRRLLCMESALGRPDG